MPSPQQNMAVRGQSSTEHPADGAVARPERIAPPGAEDSATSNEIDELYHTPPEPTSQRGILVGIGVVAATAFLFGLGVVMGMSGGPSKARASVDAPTSPGPASKAGPAQEKSTPRSEAEHARERKRIPLEARGQ